MNLQQSSLDLLLNRKFHRKRIFSAFLPQFEWINLEKMFSQVIITQHLDKWQIQLKLIHYFKHKEQIFLIRRFNFTHESCGLI